MKYLDLSLHSPEQNVGFDEQLLDEREASGGEEVLRFWESPEHFVVLGVSNKAANEVHEDRCTKDNVRVIKRASGGGTVLQGPGCLNYALILKIDNHDFALKGIKETNCQIMKHHAKALEPLIPNVSVKGYTDLVSGAMKFSGNAQRRKRNWLLFHGTFLLNMDLSKIETYLKFPSLSPEYREHRSHKDFVTNLNLPPELIKYALKKTWNAN